jgi:hypothetical protein
MTPSAWRHDYLPGTSGIAIGAGADDLINLRVLIFDGVNASDSPGSCSPVARAYTSKIACSGLYGFASTTIPAWDYGSTARGAPARSMSPLPRAQLACSRSSLGAMMLSLSKHKR